MNTQTNPSSVILGDTNAGPMRKPISRILGFHEQALAKARLAGEPLIFSGAACHWPALSDWTPETLVQRYGDQQIQACLDLPETGVPYHHTYDQYRRQLTLSQFMPHLSRGEPCYLDQGDPETFPGISSDFSFDELVPEPIQNISLWFGAHTRSGLHYDKLDNFLAQVRGRKVAFLLAPEDSSYLYPFGSHISKSKVDPETPDLATYPRFKKAVVWEGQIEPGDVLFIPKCWWHHLCSGEQSLSVNCWFGDALPKGYTRTMLKGAGGLIWLKIFSDFMIHGLLGLPYRRRLFCGPPTGKLLYDNLRSRLTRRR